MSDKTKANRGLLFERHISLMCMTYQGERRAVIYKVPTSFLPLRGKDGKVVSCKVDHKSCVDYLGHFSGVPVALEAKSVKRDYIRYDAVQDHQSDFLDDWAACGGIAAVLVAFDDDVFCVPWAYWKTGREAWIRYQCGEAAPERVTVCGCETTGKASLRPGDLLPEWRVEEMDFLKVLRTFPRT